jgi:hypothetical protein
VADEDPVFDGHSGAEKGMTRDFAVFANFNTLLDLNKRANAGSASNPAPIKVHEVRLVDNDTFAELNIRCNHSLGSGLSKSKMELKIGLEHFGNQNGVD